MLKNNITHLDPAAAAKIAKRSGAKKLALTHFDAAIYKTMAGRKAGRKQSEKIFRNCFAACDDQAISV